jgi:CRP-like cAMP-binding protein
VYHQFRNAVFHINPKITEKEWEFLTSNCSIHKYQKGEYFIEAGQKQTAIGFVNYGLLRGYYTDLKGDEITIRFVKENGYVTHYTALLKNEPSRYYFQCMETCEIVLLPYPHIQKGYDKFKGLERFGRCIAEQILWAQQSRIEDFQFLNAEDRYKKFINTHPELFNRISLSHLSTYLGIKRPSLSRIRKKLTKG